MTTTTLEEAHPPFFNITQGRFFIQIHSNDRRPIGEAILDGLQVWSESAITSDTEIMRVTVRITPRGAVRISKPHRDGLRDRWLIIEPRDAVDLANELLASE